ncbi:hypothetical protein [Sporolactobacillus terrae]|uniref:Uncharacterized protein n=1 Tax=Sporolactobacillus terrae TaxID=269673 RepID=A0A5K7WYT8_9BACL|nr:hypothetical protein [Sporolactobacillus terrae]BBN97513.1 hypothetical protein St703_02180 [Sporolactobacillus terrae]
MKTLTFKGEEFQAEKIIKTDSEVMGLVGSTVIFSFRGITDFSKFTLADGAEFDAEPASEEQQQIAEILLEQAKMKQDIATLKEASAGA